MIRILKKIILIFVPFALLLQTGCFRGVHDITAIKTGVWFFPEGHPVALRFDSGSNELKGEYIYTGQALAETSTFIAKRTRKGFKFCFSDHPNITFAGALKEDGKDYVVAPKRGRSVRLKQYERDVVPQYPARYSSRVFDKYTVTERTYGYAPGYYASKSAPDLSLKAYAGILVNVLGDVSKNLFNDSIKLELDVYRPVGDTVTDRPLLLLIHGGAFILGDKRDKLVSDMAKHYVSLGFVVASINYRIGYLFVPGMYSQLERCMYRGIQDANAALRYLSSHRKEFGIDPDKVFVAGNSAGGFLTLFTAFMDDSEKWNSTKSGLFGLRKELGCLHCSTNKYKGKFKIAGAVNLWGALTDPDIIGADDKVSTLLVHGTADKIVPYGYDYPFTNVDKRLPAFFTAKVYGSKPVYDKMKRVGVDAKLISLPGAAHEPQDDDAEVYPMILREMTSLMQKSLQGDVLKIHGQQEIADTLTTARYIALNRNDKYVKWVVEGGLVKRRGTHWVDVVWLANAPRHTLTAYTEERGGVVKRADMVLSVVKGKNLK